MRVYWAAAWLLFFLSPASAAIDAVNVYEPRNFGYFIGDTLERDIEVVTSGKTELFTAALPRPGSLTYWLDLVSISHTERDEGGRRHYDLKLKYQIFYSAIEATELDIPAFPLKFKNPASVAPDGTSPNDASDAAAKQSASIPAFRIIVAPLRDLVLVDLMPEKTKELSEVLRPDVPAREIPVNSLHWQQSSFLRPRSCCCGTILSGRFGNVPGAPLPEPIVRSAIFSRTEQAILPTVRRCSFYIAPSMKQLAKGSSVMTP